MRPTLFGFLFLVGFGLSALPAQHPDGAGRASGHPLTPLEAGSCASLHLTPDTSIDGFLSDQYVWYDHNCQPRSAALVHNDIQDPAGRWGGYMRQYTYQVDGATRVANGSSNDHPGFGYTTNHFGDQGSQDHLSIESKGDSFGTVYKGAHHAIYQFKKRLPLGGPVDATVQWFFATGRDHPVWVITYDSTPAGPDVVKADTRSPYGDIQWDGGAGSPVVGVGWGDHYKFKSVSTPLNYSSRWDYSQSNTVPYDLEWAAAVDAEMGVVQTQTYQQHDAGGYWAYSLWGMNSESPGIPPDVIEPGGKMPRDYNWTYQLNQYEIPFQDPVTSKRLAWGANFGAVGQTQYPAYGDATMLSGYPYQSYSVFIVLGKHSDAVVASQVGEVETVQRTTLTARTGSVVTKGPAGIARPDAVDYSPPGYNHIYSTWELNADDQNSVDFDMNVGAGQLTNPVFVVHNYTAAVPAQISVNGAPKQAETGFFPSLDPDTHTLWFTLAGSYTGTTSIAIAPSTAANPTATATAAPTTIPRRWDVFLPVVKP